jgi:hypothetical protein
LEAFLLIENLPFLEKSVEALAAPDFSVMPLEPENVIM